KTRQLGPANAGPNFIYSHAGTDFQIALAFAATFVQYSLASGRFTAFNKVKGRGAGRNQGWFSEISTFPGLVQKVTIMIARIAVMLALGLFLTHSTFLGKSAAQAEEKPGSLKEGQPAPDFSLE